MNSVTISFHLIPFLSSRDFLSFLASAFIFSLLSELPPPTASSPFFFNFRSATPTFPLLFIAVSWAWLQHLLFSSSCLHHRRHSSPSMEHSITIIRTQLHRHHHCPCCSSCHGSISTLLISRQLPRLSPGQSRSSSSHSSIDYRLEASSSAGVISVSVRFSHRPDGFLVSRQAPMLFVNT